MTLHLFLYDPVFVLWSHPHPTTSVTASDRPLVAPGGTTTTGGALSSLKFILKQTGGGRGGHLEVFMMVLSDLLSCLFFCAGAEQVHISSGRNQCVSQRLRSQQQQH